MEKNDEIEIAQDFLKRHGLNYDDSFKYQMLGRMQMDCDVYLGGSPQSHSSERLWANTEQEQIEIMKNLYLSFPDGQKPQWISMEDIEKYETQMTVTQFTRVEGLAEKIDLKENLKIPTSVKEQKEKAVQKANEKIKSVQNPQKTLHKSISK